MDINALFFSVVSDLTGGIVTDVKTCMLAMVAFSLLLVGLDYIKDTLNTVSIDRQSEKLTAEAHKEYSIMTTDEDISQIDRDLARARYRNRISRLGRL